MLGSFEVSILCGVEDGAAFMHEAEFVPSPKPPRKMLGCVLWTNDEFLLMNEMEVSVALPTLGVREWSWNAWRTPVPICASLPSLGLIPLYLTR